MTHALDDRPHFALTRPDPGKRASWVLAGLMHVLLAVFLIYGVSWQTSSPEVAVSVDLVRYTPTVSAESNRPAPPKEVKPEPKPEPLPPKVKVEEPPAPPKAQILRKVPEEKKPKPQPESKPVEKYDPLKKMLEQASNNQKDADARMKDAMARADSQLKAAKAADSATASKKGLADYVMKLRLRIRSKIVLPLGIEGNPEAIFVVTQLPSGEVLSVKLKTSSGIAALDTAIERAINNASPLPKPDDASLFKRELEIKYRPFDE